MTEPLPSGLGKLTTEQRNSASVEIDTLSTVDMLRVMNEEDRTVAEAVQHAIPSIATAVDAIAAAFRAGGRMVSIGAGTSGRLGVLDASECPPTFGTDPSLVVGLIAGGDHALRHAIEHVEDQPDAGAAALKEIGLTSRDVVVGIAASGRTPFVLGAVAHAREIDATTVCIANSPDSPLAAAVDIPITVVTGPEVVTGSTRMKAGTAQKLVLNMLTTGAMIGIGKTFGNLMVDVQPTNAKLRDRSIRIVADATGVERERAERALADANGEVKTAIVAILAGIGSDDARASLARAHGVVRAALDGSVS
ncbi:MAG TPA: N-acetylmuramic acid 6-phosphate etherase [Thermomicrobiales bacterium]|nr:N-acetylmuramic acid 6-phosphate etherase [Thermomicrobiales bacterium]